MTRYLKKLKRKYKQYSPRIKKELKIGGTPYCKGAITKKPKTKYVVKGYKQIPYKRGGIWKIKKVPIVKKNIIKSKKKKVKRDNGYRMLRDIAHF